MSIGNGSRAVCAVAALTCAAMFASAPAAQAQTGCPTGFTLMSVPDVLRTLAAPGSETAIQAGDVNRNGYLCVQLAAGGGLSQFTDDQA
jgi:hypothetical protein